MNRLAALLPLTLVLVGCASHGIAPRAASRTARINHVVFMVLADPADAPALLADCDDLIPTIPSVTTYFAGPHYDSGRATVLDDYDVGLYVGFEDQAGYDAYLVHPNHLELVETWRPRVEALLVRDIVDDTP